MPVTYKGEHRGSGTVSIGHDVGDLLLVTVLGNSVPPLASGYTNIGTIINVNGGLYARAAYKFATSTAESMNVWSGYNFLSCKVFSGVSTTLFYTSSSETQEHALTMSTFNPSITYTNSKVAVFDYFYYPYFSLSYPGGIFGGPSGATQYANNVPISSGTFGYFSYQTVAGNTQFSACTFEYWDDIEANIPSTTIFSGISMTIQLDGTGGGFRVYYTTG